MAPHVSRDGTRHEITDLSLASRRALTKGLRGPVVGHLMKTPLLDLVPGLAAAAPIFRAPARKSDRERTPEADDPGDGEPRTAARQDCKPP